MKKKTSKKTATKSAKTSAKKTSAKSAGSGGKGIGSGIKRTSKKIADKVLSTISPPLQNKIDQLIQTLETSREGRMGDLSLLAGKILIRAQEVSRSLRNLKGKKEK